MDKAWITLFLLWVMVSSGWCYSCRCGIEQPGRIINGKETRRGRYPWMVSLIMRIEEGKYASCGGSLINDRYVLTAAHCLSIVKSPEDVIVTLFAHTSEDRVKLPKVGVESLIKNPHWGTEGYGNHHDLSLIKLKERLIFTASSSPICLPTKNTPWLLQLRDQEGKEGRRKENNNVLHHHFQNMTSTRDPAGNQTIPSHSPDPHTRSVRETAFVTGWGQQNSLFAFPSFKVNAKALFETKTSILDTDACEDMWKDHYDEEYEICAGTGVCQGDSGGPLAVRVNGSVTQVGVVSYGPGTCNIGLFLGPTVYERISAHLDFIHAHTRDAIWCGP